MTIGKRLLGLRQKNSLTQEDVASIFHVSRQTVSKWESDLSYPDMKLLMEICEYYHVSVLEVLGLEEEVNEESLSKLYLEMQNVLGHMESENVKRRKWDQLIIVFCVLSMIVSVVLFINVSLKERKLTHVYNNYNQGVVQTQSLFDSQSRYEIKAYDLNQMQLEIDCEYVLSEYTDDLTMKLIVESTQGRKEYDLIKKNENTFVFQGSIPYVDQQKIKVSVVNSNGTVKLYDSNLSVSTIEELFLSQTVLYMKKNDNGQVERSKIYYTTTNASHDDSESVLSSLENVSPQKIIGRLDQDMRVTISEESTNGLLKVIKDFVFNTKEDVEINMENLIGLDKKYYVSISYVDDKDHEGWANSFTIARFSPTINSVKIVYHY